MELIDSTTTVLDRLAHAAKVVEGLGIPADVHTSVHVSRFSRGGGRAEVDVHCDDVDTLKALRRTIGPMEKSGPGPGFPMTLVAEVDGVRVQLWPPSGTCKRVQVGTETVEREVPTATETVTEEVPVYEWDCGPILADEEAVPA